MNVSQIQDLVRLQSGIPDLAPELLTYAMVAGRKEIETRGNFYWQATHVDFTTLLNTPDYDVQYDLGALKFKEPRFLFLQKASGQKWLPVSIGSWYSTLPETTDVATGFPEKASYENGVLTLIDMPDAQYNAKLFYFAWTDNPADITNDDDLFANHPQLILTASIYSLLKLTVRNPDAATPWEQAMDDEIEKAKALTDHILKEPANRASAREAAQILQAQGSK